MRARIAVFLIVIQSILLFAHWFIYTTWKSFSAINDPPGITPLETTVAVLSVTFIAASLLAFRFSNPLVRSFYRISALWLGAVNFLSVAACMCWLLYFAATLTRHQPDWPRWAAVVFAAALIATLYGVLNARWIRTRRVRIALPNLPDSWRGRIAALVSDVHLGHVNGAGFLARIVARVQSLKPDIVFMTGDLYDGTAIVAAPAAAPLQKLNPPLGTFFVTGNHEEFRDPSQYLAGDLVTWLLPGNLPHIGIVSDQFAAGARRPKIIHNIGGGPVEDDILFAFPISGHYRYRP